MQAGIHIAAAASHATSDACNRLNAYSYSHSHVCVCLTTKTDCLRVCVRVCACVSLYASTARLCVVSLGI